MTLATLGAACSQWLEPPPLNPTQMHHHVVRGEVRHGLIVDPGAASALMGTETLRSFLQESVDLRRLPITIEPSNATFTGVDGRPEPGLGVVTVPLGIPGLPGCSFRTDLIGNEGSTCPGLLPLNTLLDHLPLMQHVRQQGRHTYLNRPTTT